ncbi:MAG: 4'-phosphopantetheinyl transferase family protein [Solirubrobacteraceae bacterium]
MLQNVLPAAVAFAETTLLMRSQLTPVEAHALGAAAPRRAAEFATGRSLARLALCGLGIRGATIARGADREPIWPTGVVGSITHCTGYCAAAVAVADAVRSVGIDAETHAPLPPGILQRVALPEEAAWTRAHAGAGIHWDRALFSAKESVFKTWFPLTRRWLGFDEARITFTPVASVGAIAAGTFRAELLVSPPMLAGTPITAFDGRFVIDDGHVVTAIALGGARARSGDNTT